jgi:hypothetical protein
MKTFNLNLAKTLYLIAIKQGDVNAAGRIYDKAKLSGFNLDQSIKNR